MLNSVEHFLKSNICFLILAFFWAQIRIRIRIVEWDPDPDPSKFVARMFLRNNFPILSSPPTSSIEHKYNIKLLLSRILNNFFLLFFIS